MSFTNEAFSIECCEDEHKLMVSFGGICEKPGMPIFEFKNLFSSVNINKIFVVDKNRSWYFLDVNSLVSRLSSLIEEYGKEYVLFYGNSMGGFAALKFGSIFNVDRVVAFSPQTFISRRLRKKHSDCRWYTYVEKLFSLYTDNELELCIKDNGKTVYDVYYSKRDKLDSIHANYLKGVPRLTNNGLDVSDHNLVKDLKDSGQLVDIILGTYMI